MNDDDRTPKLVPHPTPARGPASGERGPIRNIDRSNAIAAIVALTTLTTDEVEGFLACAADERAELIASYRDAGKIPDVSVWQRVVGVLKVCAELVALVSPIEGAVAGVFGLVKGPKP